VEKTTKEEVGQHVIYTDEVAVDHDALVTAIWGPACINVLYVSEHESKQDQYGRQIERPSSVSHVSQTTAHGRYYRLVGEDKRPVLPAVAS
jgi:hypothetical protein